DAVTHAPVAGYVITIEEVAGVALQVSESRYRGARPENERPPENGAAGIHIDSIACPLEAAILRHVTELSKLPVVLDRPGGVVHSDREIRLTVPASAEQQHAVEFGVLRGLLELVEPARLGGQAKHSAATAAPSKKSWYHKLFA
ncbi:MAG: hypothetical protein DMG33_16410, partial [Acidobacteria bacterium]